VRPPHSVTLYPVLIIGMNGEIKIGDFGWSVYSPQEDRCDGMISTVYFQLINSQRTIAGTLSYVAPEMILGQPYGRAVDIWVCLHVSQHAMVD
jgi:serine/threonine protein kinase